MVCFGLIITEENNLRARLKDACTAELIHFPRQSPDPPSLVGQRCIRTFRDFEDGRRLTAQPK